MAASRHIGAPSKMDRSEDVPTLAPMNLEKWQQPYTYSPLDSKADEIRLLTLLPDVFSAPIRITLETHKLTEETQPVYEALSYVWGSTDDPITINVGRQGNDILAVTQNLGSALRHLRSADKPRIFWVDAICVNQQDLDERSRQVEKMGSIFRLASRVVAWLGDEKDDSTYALDLLAFIASQVEVDWNIHEMKPARRSGVDDTWADRRIPWSLNGKDSMALYSLLHRSWFERVWIRQEILLANEDAIMQCGLKTILWEVFRNALFGYFYKSKLVLLTNHKLVSLSARDKMIFELCNVRTLDFSTILQEARLGKCSDPRDKVYALLSLGDGRLNLKADYTKSTAEVYKDLVLRYIADYGDFDILRYCEPHSQPTQLPSWIPDWSAATLTNSLSQLAWASGSTYAYALHENDGILKTCGVQIGLVGHVERILLSTELGRSEDLKEIRRLALKFMLERYTGGSSGLDVFCSTLCSGFFRDAYEPLLRIAPDFEESKEVLGAWLNNEQIADTLQSSVADIYLSEISHCSRNRSLIYCKDGHIGLGPRYTLPSDVICVLFSCSYPSILRPVQDHQFQFVGACYIHGFMHNEAFLGPLASNFQAVNVRNPSSGKYYPGYRNLETGKHSMQDPRLTPEEQATWKSRDFPRDAFLSASDPSLTPEILKKRGIKPQIFELI